MSSGGCDRRSGEGQLPGYGTPGIEEPASLDAARMSLALRGQSKPPRKADGQELGARQSGAVVIGCTVTELAAVLRRELERVADLQDEVLTRHQVAQLLGVCDRTVDKLVKQVGLPVVMVGSQKRFLRSQVLAWLKDSAATQAQSTVRS